MLELGYERDVQTILTALNEAETAAARQTMLLSATLTTGKEQLSEVSMKHPTFVDAATGDAAAPTSSDALELTTPDNLKQNFVIVPAKLRLVVLAAFIVWKARLSKARKKVLVFMATQDMVDFHCDLFDRCLNSVESNDGGSDDEKDGLEDDELTEDAKAVMQVSLIYAFTYFHLF